MRQQLLAAIEALDLRQVQALLDTGIAIDDKLAGRPVLVMALVLAVQLRQVEMARALIAAGADVNWVLPETPLHLAARSGDQDLVNLLLKAGAAIEELTLNGQTALMLAAGQGHLAVVKQLVASGADVNAWMDGETPLLHAAIGSHTAVYDFLEPLVDVDIQRYVSRELAKSSQQRQREQQRDVEELIAAAMMGELTEVESAIAQGIAMDAIGANGRTALMAAAQAGQLAIVEALLLAGANPHQCSEPKVCGQCWTARDWAIAAGQLAVVDRLKQAENLV
jgi:ankyrin repeat protein